MMRLIPALVFLSIVVMIAIIFHAVQYAIQVAAY